MDINALLRAHNTIFRRRHGHGRKAFGVVTCVDVAYGAGEGLKVTATISEAPRHQGPYGMMSYGKTLGQADLLNLTDSEWAPVTVSRIRGRS